ncbi:16S rRNA (cytosine(1402)-N(4))-methyltransferase RsmH [Govanella unica]|uniref:Ribosomal RNA small subunit methyltransferase H n=1 Tax=Govanella unica TaxID=2975056 RepID=A0A9X3U0F9_9PROT|nr:16S rRNA (cytosine(1402)-N(4))-methyltransferase RsmH [Govania unica]MDA5195070.1 16S rRNA (cytosine(1402)-N(4))-methyltransferase RsmH [Govania unica]
MTLSAPSHISVLLREVLTMMAPRDGATYVDGTFGAGGYSRALLEAADCTVYGIDRDPTVAPHAERLAADFPGRFHLLPGCYGDMAELLAEAEVTGINGVMLDIGVSSMQIDQAERGFSFQSDGPLDMRMGREGPTAADLVNNLEADELADIIFKYGEERHSRRIARALVSIRADRPFTRTRELAEAVSRALPSVKKKPGAIHPATRTFQALRIAVNDELGELERGLQAAEHVLAPDGRLVVVSFHSLEDRIVKTFLRERSGGQAAPSRHLPEVQDLRAPSFEILTRKALEARDDETAVNPRSRSAKLRAARRTDAPARDLEVAA